jgi:hypothetical protein
VPFQARRQPGWADVFSHLLSHVGKDMQRFKQGDGQVLRHRDNFD